MPGRLHSTWRRGLIESSGPLILYADIFNFFSVWNAHLLLSRAFGTHNRCYTVDRVTVILPCGSDHVDTPCSLRSWDGASFVQELRQGKPSRKEVWFLLEGQNRPLRFWKHDGVLRAWLFPKNLRISPQTRKLGLCEGPWAVVREQCWHVLLSWDLQAWMLVVKSLSEKKHN